MVRLRRDRALRVVVVIAGLGIATQLMIIAGTNQDNETAPPDIPTAIEQLLPKPGAVVRPQESVGADLQDEFTGVLTIDGREEIPEDQYERVESLGRVVFRPGPGKDVELFEPGPHSVTVTWWPKTMDRNDEGTPVSSYTWPFSVG